MPQPTKLLLGVHAHQPVGNFPEVLDDANARCYKPFLECMARYPDFPFSIHYSGWLLEYLLKHDPKTMAILREMVQRGQAELVGAGDTEPVLAIIPAVDRVGQIQALSSRLEHHFGQRPRGAWLTERVWEATVVPSLADSDIRYTTVDDYHFLCAGQDLDKLDGYFTTEEDGRRLDLFPISEALRYKLPFSPAHEVVQYLESLANEQPDRAAIYFDDIEKFGIWPETYHWVYEQGWLEQFLRGVLASPLITPMRFRDYHEQANTRGIVYLPTTSYIEMNEWTLPAKPANAYADLLQEQKDKDRFASHKAFVRGGIWKNFLSRYPESNWMHKRMLTLSKRLHALPKNQQNPAMFDALYQAQANDAYWHGLFGGLYLPHLRRAIYQGIVSLEAMLDSKQARPPIYMEDLNFDGSKEVFLHNSDLQIIVCPQHSACIGEMDLYALKHNLGDSLARQEEHYYRKILAYDNANRAEAQKTGIDSPHDRVDFKHQIHADDLGTDPWPRGMFLDFWKADDNAEQSLEYSFDAQQKSLDSIVFESVDGLQISKHYQLALDRLTVDFYFKAGADRPMRGDFCTQINLAMPSCDGPAGRILLDREIIGGFGSPYLGENLNQITLIDDILGGTLQWDMHPPADWQSAPHFSVSQSEAGFEKIMQALTLTLRWRIDLDGADAKQRVRVQLRVLTGAHE